MQILGFDGQYSFLSNFHPIWIRYEGLRYPTTEHAYQAAKFEDPAQKRLVSLAKTPGQAKKMGQGPGKRADWEKIKEGIMLDVLIYKFSQPEMMDLLIATGDAYIEETNTWNDTYWGVCGGVGQNKLGEILMELRGYLREIKEVWQRG